MMDLYIKLSVCVPRLIPGRGFYAQISSEITSEFPGVTSKKRKVGRQRKNRMPSALEKGKGKATRQIKCPECGVFGHWKGSARCELTGTKRGRGTRKQQQRWEGRNQRVLVMNK
uniref:Uncharacterized protein n=1 Tax=Oryza rufipogon TaxID=4529 RepID=A0A0E0P6F9_ORYRU